MKKRNLRLSWFYVPGLCLLLFFVVRPFCETVYISLCEWNGYSLEKKFVGFKNYLDMFSDSKLLSSCINTIIYGFVSTLFQNVLGMGMAFFVNSRFKGRNIVRVVVYLPILISGLIMGYIMYFFLVYDNGVLNDILNWFGMEPIDWLADGKRGVFFITLINIWQYSGYSMIMYLSGIQGIPKMYVESAKIEGAGSIQCFWHVMLPLLMPAITTSVITNLIGGLKLYEGIISLTNGGPNYATHSMVSYLNNRYFYAEKAGYASAIGISLFLMIMLVSILGNGYFEKKQVDM